MPPGPSLFSLPLAVALSLQAINPVMTQQAKAGNSEEATIGATASGKILEGLGANLEHGVSSKQLDDYSQHFARLDRDGDGRHSKVEYIENDKRCAAIGWGHIASPFPTVAEKYL